MSYKNRRRRGKREAQFSRDGEAAAERAVLAIRADLDLAPDEEIPDLVLVNEAASLFAPKGEELMKRYVRARLEGRGDNEIGRDQILMEILEAERRRKSDGRITALEEQAVAALQAARDMAQ